MSILLLLLLLGPPHDVPDTTASCPTSLICPGEELVYEVRWFSAGLGQVRFQTESINGDSSSPRYSASVHLDSYKLPFVDVHSSSHSRMDTLFNSREYESVEWTGDEWAVQNYHIEESKGRIIAEKDRKKSRFSEPLGPATFDTLGLIGASIQDGLSAVYFARAHAHSRDTFRVPIMVYGKQGMTTFMFGGEQENVSIDALGGSVRAVRFRGLAEFDGILGLTGDFTGWLTDDVAAIPIKIEMKVVLGSVVIELVEWKREGWAPPVVPEQH